MGITTLESNTTPLPCIPPEKIEKLGTMAHTNRPAGPGRIEAGA